MKPTVSIIEWFQAHMNELRELQLKAREGQRSLWELHEHIEKKENMLRGKARQEGCATALCFECVLPACLTLLLLCGCSMFKEPAWMGMENQRTNSLPSGAPMNALPPQVLYQTTYHLPITWDNPTNNLAAYNRVYLGAVQGSRTHIWQIPLTNKFTLKNLTNGALHYFEVVTVNTNGRESTALAGQIKIDFRK